MNLVPKSLSRVSHRSLLKLRGASPTILVVAGVGGLVASAVLAGKASRNLDPVLDQHKKARDEIAQTSMREKDEQKAVLNLYIDTAGKLTKLYGPALFVGTASAVSVLGGHKLLHTRHVATMAAYSGLMDQFKAYRKRIAQTLGDDVERGIYEGARGEWQEDPENKGEYKFKPVFDEDNQASYLRPWFDETNPSWTRDAVANYAFLKGVQSHMNNLLQIRGHVFLNELFDALGMDRCPEGAAAGWLRDGDGDGYVDLGFMTSIDPHTVAFRNHVEKTVKLNFNIDGTIWNRI